MAGRVVAFIVGLGGVAGVMISAIRTVILPRAASSRLTRIVFIAVRLVLRAMAPRARSFARRDTTMAFLAPVALLTLLGVWLTLVVLGYTAVFWALDNRHLVNAFELSGSSAFTLGFDRPADLWSNISSFTESAVALLLLALLIAYLPTIYSSFSRREAAVSSLETRAGSPPSAAVFIERLAVIGGLDDLVDTWEQWEWWFVELQETHTSYPAVAFLRSPLPDHSWVTAAGAVLDTAALVESAIDRPPDPAAQLCLRAGWLSLRRVAETFRIPFEHDPAPDDPISIQRAELESVLDRMSEQGIPLKHDRDQIWRDFAGWRVNYDSVLLDLATLCVAPLAAWSSDREGSWRPWWVGRQPRDFPQRPPGMAHLR